MPDPGLPGAVLLVVALLLAAVTVWYVDRRGRRGNSKSGAMHGMERDRTVGYFGAADDAASAPGVREEDRSGRWGEDDTRPR